MPKQILWKELYQKLKKKIRTVNYNIIPFKSAGKIRFNMQIKDVVNLLGNKHDITELDFYPGKQFYFSELALKILFDKEEKVKGIYFYNESPEFHKILYEGDNLFELNYSNIKKNFNNYQCLEDSESLVILDLGLTFYFQEEKTDDPFPEEVGIFRSDLKSFYSKSYKIKD